MENKGYENDSENKNTNLHNQNKSTAQSEGQPLKHTFEEAVFLIESGKFHFCFLLACGICVTSFISETLGVSVLMASAKCDLSFTLYEQGLLASVGFLGVVLSSHTIGFFADTSGRNKTLKYSVIISTICSLISVFSINVWMLIVMRFLVGFFINGCQSCIFSYMGEFHSTKTKTKYVTLLTIFFAIGALYFPAIGIGILPLELDYYIGTIKFSSWRLLLILNSLPSIIASIALLFLPESPKFLLVQGKHNEALEILKNVYEINTGKNKELYPVQFIITNEESAKDLAKVKSVKEAVRAVWIQTKPLFNKERRWITIILSINQFVIFFVCHGSFMWIPGIIKPIIEYSNSSWTLCHAVRCYNNELNNAKAYSNYLECTPEKRVDIFVLEMLVILAFAFGILYLIFAFIIDKIGKRRLLLIWMLLCGPPILILICSKGFAFNITLLFFYMIFGNCAGLITSITVNYYPTNISGMAMCLVMMTGRLGSFVGSNIIGIILYQQCEYLFVLLFSMVCLLLILWNFLPKD